MEWYYILAMVLGSILAILIAVKAYIKLTTGMCRCKTRIDGKTAIVTGANTGIGYETAAELARRGARVILACRDTVRGNEAVQRIVRETGNTDVHCRKVDFASLRSVREFARDVLASEPHIHILVNNAGAGGLGNRKSEDNLQLGLQVNHFGPFLLTNLLLRRLVESAPSRIVMVSAWGHKLAKIDLDDINMEREWRDTLVYCNSKLCNVITANEITRRLQGTRVTANSLHPGIVMTEIFRNMPAVFRVPIHAIIKLFLKTSYEGAQTSVYLAVSPEVEGVSGQYFVDCKPAAMSEKAQDEDFAKRIWEISEKCVQLHPKETYSLIRD